jgi:hypothetical protein
MTQTAGSSPPVIAPRNLTARAEHRVVGNPDTSRPEDSVGNCFPGLDLDVRSLDRRFFPGLVFDYISEDEIEPDRVGALLMHHDGYGDSDLRPEYLLQLDEAQREAIDKLRRVLFRRLTGGDGTALTKGVWYLDWVQQGGASISMQGAGAPLDGLVVWRIVRGLEPGPVTIGLRRRDPEAEIGSNTMVFEGWRRQFTSPRTGVISHAYQPGELLMSMCSPWQHDFRDCACHYWASNRPDVVHGMPAPNATETEKAAVSARRIDWMRADRSPSAASASLNTLEANRPYQMDHFEINRTWQDLNVVIGNTEISGTIAADRPKDPLPQSTGYASKADLIAALCHLAALEMTLALEYLYAYFSLIPATAPAPKEFPDLLTHVSYVRNTLLNIAIGEMQHLRWANELLWRITNDDQEFAGTYKPVINPASEVPIKHRKRRRRLRPLDAETLQDFINSEAPSNSIDGQYARVVVTLDQGDYSPDSRALASLIVADGVEHYNHFTSIQTKLAQYDDVSVPPFLRPLRLDKGDADVQDARMMFDEITNKLVDGYTALAAGQDGQAKLNEAHDVMMKLMAKGEELAARGLGISFW